MTAGTTVTVKPPKTTGVVIHRDPPVILGGLGGRAHDYPMGAASCDALLEQDRPLYFFFCPQWSFADRKYLETNIRALADRMTRFPQHRFTVLVNDPVDQFALQAVLPQARTFVWNTNCTADASLFALADDVQRDIPAVYIARFSGYKRLELAAAIGGLRLITRPVTPEQVPQLRAMLPRATIPNLDEGGAYRVLSPREVAAILARAACGLMLSRLEGQNRSVMEYLLCGLPVVTTASHGGRDRFLTPANSLYVNPDPVAVADGARFAAGAGYDRAAIRAEALRGIEIERKRLADIVNTVITADGERPIALADLHLPHKTSSNVNGLDSFFAALGRDPPPPAAYVSAPVQRSGS